MVGRKKRFYSQYARSITIRYLAPIEFFERAGISMARGDRGCHRRDQGGIPGDPRRRRRPHPAHRVPARTCRTISWAELNNSPRWSAFHLFKMGKLIEENAAQCPTDHAGARRCALSPISRGRTPSAMFSLLKPKTRILGPTRASPTCGSSRTCRSSSPKAVDFRVGNDTRQWVPGRAWVFDDTIEHEAWNDSDQLRVVLIFDDLAPAALAGRSGR